MRKWVLITGSTAVTAAPAAVVATGAVTDQSVEWWRAWGQWIGAGGSIVAAVAALWIAWWGWERAEKHRGADAEAVRESDRRKDLDETRRIALTAHLQGNASPPEVVATVVNALVYHSKIVRPDEAQQMLNRLRSTENLAPVLQQLINSICKELGDRPM